MAILWYTNIPAFADRSEGGGWGGSPGWVGRVGRPGWVSRPGGSSGWVVRGGWVARVHRLLGGSRVGRGGAGPLLVAVARILSNLAFGRGLWLAI